jgi:methionyl-tRNA formyltransferase
LRVIFAGTPEFARAALERLHAAGFAIPLVLTQPDRPAGRGMKLQASPVKQFAIEYGVALAQPRSLRLDGKYPEDAAAAKAAIEQARADAMVVAAYGLILPQWVLDALSAAGPQRHPKAASGGGADASASSAGPLGLGCLNIHASLLPRWRGAAPIHRAIEAGDAETGVTIMQMDAGLDTGDMLLVQRVAIEPDDSTGSLQDKLAVLGGRLIVQALELAARGELEPVKQPEQGVTYARKIEKAEASVDWREPAEVIARRIRAFDPFPGASAVLVSEPIKLWRGEPVPDAGGTGGPGTIVAASPEGIDVRCGQGLLRLTQLQRAGGKRLAVAEFLRGFDARPGMAFET